MFNMLTLARRKAAVDRLLFNSLADLSELTLYRQQGGFPTQVVVTQLHVRGTLHHGILESIYTYYTFFFNQSHVISDKRAPNVTPCYLEPLKSLFLSFCVFCFGRAITLAAPHAYLHSPEQYTEILQLLCTLC